MRPPAESPLLRGQARVEFIALKQEIQDLLAQGHTNRSVHGSLFAAGRITMSYAMFCRYVIQFFPKKKKPQSQRAGTSFPAPVPAPMVSQPGGSKKNGEEAFHNKEQPANEVLDILA